MSLCSIKTFPLTTFHAHGPLAQYQFLWPLSTETLSRLIEGVDQAALPGPLSVALVTVRFYGERLLAIMADTAGPAVLHVGHGCLLLQLRHPEYLVMAIRAFLFRFRDVKLVAVHHIAPAPLTEKVMLPPPTSPHVADATIRHAATDPTNAFFMLPLPLLPRLTARPERSSSSCLSPSSRALADRTVARACPDT